MQSQNWLIQLAALVIGLIIGICAVKFFAAKA